MNRRTFAMLLGAGVFSGVHFARAARAQDATPPAASPVAGNAIPPLRWTLQQIASGRKVLTPDNPADYWVQFRPDGKIAIKADCNQGSGGYLLSGSSLTIAQIATTKVPCAEGSLSDIYLGDLDHVVSFVIAGDAQDQLVLSMMADGGELHFAPALSGVVWQWVSVEVDGKETVRVDDSSRYTLAFADDGSVAVLADCNRGKGNAAIDGHNSNYMRLPLPAWPVAGTRKATSSSTISPRRKPSQSGISTSSSPWRTMAGLPGSSHT